MGFRDKIEVLVGGQNYAHQLFGKDLKIFRQNRGQNWANDDALELFRAIESMPGRSARLHGVELSVLNHEQAKNLQVGDLVLQVGGDFQRNSVLRKTVTVVERVEEVGENGPLYHTRKVWPVSVDWSYIGYQSPENFTNPGNHLEICPDIFPALYFGFRVVNRDCYEQNGNQHYTEAAAKARQFMALLECYLIGYGTKSGKQEKANALDQEHADIGFGFPDHNFRGAYYSLRSVLLDKTLQNYGGLYNAARGADRITPLMRSMLEAIGETIGQSCNTSECEKDAPVFKNLLDPEKATTTVEQRLRALLNPTYVSEAQKKDHWILYNRWGIIKLLAQNVKWGSHEARVLKELYLDNFTMLCTEVGMPGLRQNSLDNYFQQ